MRIILASGSPRRRELIRKVTDDFEVITSDVDERSIENEIMNSGRFDDMLEAARLISRKLSYEKALAVFKEIGEPDDAIVIGADTSVALSDEILGKPEDREDAVRMLRKESLEPQKVITGVSFVSKKKTITFDVITKVIFHKLDEVQEARIQAYCDTPEPYDKAGAYGIQKCGDSLVESYDGDYNNIIGFPVDMVISELDKF